MQQVISSNVYCWLILVAIDIINKLFYQLVYYLRLVCVGMEWCGVRFLFHRANILENVGMYAISGSICFYL